jgi:hypothetical protein
MFFIQLQGCSPEPAPKFTDVKTDVLNKIELFEEVASKALAADVTRISKGGKDSEGNTKINVFPKGQLPEAEAQWFLERFEQLGIEIGIQVEQKEQVVEFIYWSTGLLDRGHSLVIVKSDIDLNNVTFYGRKIAEGVMDCKKIKDGWFACYD